MAVAEVRDRLLEAFERWGKPGAMRVDNGAPLGVPTMQAVSALALWLIAIDVDMIWNQPHHPQQNGRVEKMQDTTARWAEVSRAVDLADLQQKLNTALQHQREDYPVVRLGNKTRLAAFPALETSRRPYAAADFQVQRVYAFLHQKLYSRKVSANGQIRHFGQVYSVGTALKHQWVQLRLSADGSYWQVFANYKLVKKIPATNLTEERIQNLTVFQRTNDTT